MAFKAIFFDAAGTLFETAAPVEETYTLVAKKYGVAVSGREIGERFRACFSSAPPLAFPGADSGQIRSLEYSWWKELVRRIF
ncbi:MAG: HAD-IA family hydrolase, partial [Candidatus Binatia bacterium]